MGKDGNREQVITKYHEWFLKPEQAQLLNDARVDLRGKIVGCWCKPAALYQLKAINLSVANDTPTIISVLSARVSIIGCACTQEMIHSVPQQFCLSCKVLTPINNELLESFSDLVEYSAAIEKQYQDKDA